MQRHGEDDDYDDYDGQNDEEAEESDERLMMEDIDENNTINSYMMPHAGAVSCSGAQVQVDQRDFSSAVFRMG